MAYSHLACEPEWTDSVAQPCLTAPFASPFSAFSPPERCGLIQAAAETWALSGFRALPRTTEARTVGAKTDIGAFERQGAGDDRIAVAGFEPVCDY